MFFTQSADRHFLVGAWLFPAAVIACSTLFALRRRIGTGPLLALSPTASDLSALGFLQRVFHAFCVRAEPFQYLAGMPVCALIAAAGARAFERIGTLTRLAVGAVVVVACSALNLFRESPSTKTTRPYFLTSLERNPDAWVAAYNLGFTNQDRTICRSIQMYRSALRVRPMTRRS